MQPAPQLPTADGEATTVPDPLPEGLRERVRTFEEVVVPAAAAPVRLPAGEVVVTLSAAVRERKRVRMRYRAGDSGETRRAVDPYAVVQGDAFWYTFGYCHLRGGRRLFRLDRVITSGSTRT